MRPIVKTLLIVLACFLALGGGCGEVDSETGEFTKFDEEGNRLDADGNIIDPDPDDGSSDADDESLEFEDEEDFDDEDVAGGECTDDCEDDDDSVVEPGADEICDGPKEDSCTWEPAVVENVWGIHGDLAPSNDWQVDPDTAHRGENPNAPLPYFVVALPDGILGVPGDWALLGVQVDGAALEGFTEGLDPRDPGCAPATPVEAGAFLTDPNRRNVLVVDGWSTCAFETQPGGSLFTYAYEGNPGGLFDYFASTTFGEGPSDWFFTIEPQSVDAHSPDGAVFPIVSDFDGDGSDDLEWNNLPP